ncbi:MAG: hypothetical protein ACK5SP_01770 [bacterium]|jgi:hypothetical protein
MITIFGLKLTYEAAVFFALFLASEIIGVSKFKSNSLVQIFLKVVDLMRPLRSEDDKIKKVKDSIL